MNNENFQHFHFFLKFCRSEKLFGANSKVVNFSNEGPKTALKLTKG